MNQNRTNDDTDKDCNTGLTQEISVLLAYLFGWVGGIVFLLTEKKNLFVRFHAMQSTILSIFVTILFIVISFLSIIPVIGIIFVFIIRPILAIGTLILVIILIVKTYSGQNIRLPIIADMADKWLKTI